MKTHFGFFEDCGDYESSFSVCEETVCGYPVTDTLEDYVSDDWEDVSCKKCLKLKNVVMEGQKADEIAIVSQMGEMAEFIMHNQPADSAEQKE